MLQAVAAGAYADVALERALREHPLVGPDRGLATELAYGAIRRRRSLDAWLDRLGKVPARKQPPKLRWLLHLGLYQLIASDRVPAAAAVAAAAAPAVLLIVRPSRMTAGQSTTGSIDSERSGVTQVSAARVTLLTRSSYSARAVPRPVFPDLNETDSEPSHVRSVRHRADTVRTHLLRVASRRCHPR